MKEAHNNSLQIYNIKFIICKTEFKYLIKIKLILPLKKISLIRSNKMQTCKHTKSNFYRLQINTSG